MMLKVLDVDGAVKRVAGGWEATGQSWNYDADRYARVAAERAREQQAMLGYIATGSCRMDYLRRELDDPAAAPCGRCDNCTGRRWPDEVPAVAATAARDRLLVPGTEIEPRKMWPTGMRDLGIDVAGKIGPDASARPGRALGRLADLGWGPRLRAVLAPDAPDGPVPDDLVAAVVKVLAAWQWDDRPAGVVSVPSRTRPQLIGTLTSKIAEIGRLPELGSLAYAGRGQAAPGRQSNSAQRLLAVWNTLVVPDSVAGALSELPGPVLLIDDLLDTGWTLTVAAMRLRAAGATGVLPLVLATAAG
jgi:ATP-dependent DNA helicase RecQ